MCPDCGSLNLTAESFDFGICSQTGYSDSGELFRCRDCGARGPVEDVLEAPARIAPQSERGTAAKEKSA